MRVNATLVAAMLTGVLLTGGCKSAPPTTSPATTATTPARSDGTTAASPAPAPNSSSSAPGSTSAPGSVPPSAAAAAAPAPAAAVAPAEPPPPPVTLTAPSGASVVVTVTEQLSASKNNVGDGFTGVLAQSVKAPGGAVVFPRGAHVVGTVVAAKGQGRFKGSGALGIQVTSISGMRVNVSSYEKEQKGKGKRTAGFIGGGAGGGALIGGLAGGGKGALIGGLIGAGAGTAGAAFTGNNDVVIPSESTITFHLTAPVTVTVKPKEGAAGPEPLPPPQ
jgi:hypothetical protein